jgi:hypothetical protein
MHSDIFFYIFNYFRSEIIAREDGEQLEAAALPLVIRERDTEYQFHRIVLYDRLIKVKFSLGIGLFPPEGFKLFAIVQYLVYCICFSQHVKEK